MKEGPTKDLLLETNGGLDILCDEIDYVTDEQGRSKPLSDFTKGDFFSLRNEKVPSAHLWKSKDGIWYIKDFGEQKGLDAISYYAKTHGVDGKLAFIEIAQKYRKSHPERYQQTTFDRVPQEKGEVKGDISATVRNFTERDLRFFGPNVTEETLKFYNWEAVDEMRVVCESDVILKKSTASYPIFRRKCLFTNNDTKEEDFFYKYYEPRAPKRYRFKHFPNGKKPDDYVHGLYEIERYIANKDGEKLRYLIIGSGEHDCMNIASFSEFNEETGRYENPYRVVWMNSETAKIKESLMRKLKILARQIVNVPDIDSTGIEAGNRIARENIDVLIFKLPNWISTINDDRGNPCKDFSDFTELGADQNDIASLISNACKFRFWSFSTKKDRAGNEEIFCSLDKLNIVFALNVLGYRHKVVCGVDEYYYERGHIINHKTTNEIQNELVQYLTWAISEPNMKLVLNAIMSTNQFSSWCKFLDQPREDVDIREKYRQRFYFKDSWVEIENQLIKKMSYNSLDTDIMAERIRPYKFTSYKPIMDLNWLDEIGDVQVNVKNNSCILLQYMIVTSMIYWQEDLEARRKAGEITDQSQLPIMLDSPYLTEEQIDEQIKSFCNKLFIMGYMMSSFKDPSKPWIVYLMDNALGESTESNGGSGKSLFNLFANILKNDFLINGKDMDATTDKFKYDGLTKQFDLITFDDLDKSFRVEQLFADATNDMVINVKGKTSMRIPKELSPKIRVTTNYVPIVLDASSKRRLLMGTWSSFFHVMTSGNGFENTYTPRMMWGKNLITEFSQEEMNETICCLLDCLRYYYLCTEHDMVKECIIRNIEMKQLRLQVGGDFLDWFTMFFDPDNGHCNMEVEKKTAYLNYRTSSDKPIGQNMFTRKIKQYCSLSSCYEYNPVDVCNSQGRIIKKIGQETQEFIYVRKT